MIEVEVFESTTNSYGAISPMEEPSKIVIFKSVKELNEYILAEKEKRNERNI